MTVDYPQTLAYLFARLPMYQRIGAAAYKADLSNTHALMDLLGHPEHGLRCVHVAGTNGKGSTTSFIASILQEAGYRTGLHTSPHLKDFRERFRMNGTMIPEQDVVRFVEEYRAGFEPINASFFEWGVALALWWFKEQRVDIAVIETGMGGRLDSTNVVTPEVSVITNIGFDHTAFLGETLTAIAGEKAGIIKPGVPVAIGAAQGDVLDVFRRKATELDAPLHVVDRQMPVPYPIGLHGDHQAHNARTALVAVECLRAAGWKVPETAERAGCAHVVTNTGLRGRWETIGHAPLTIADVAHNAHGLRTVQQMLHDTPHQDLHVVLGMVNDKDIDGALAELPRQAHYYFCKAAIPRGLPEDLLQQQAARAGLQGQCHPSVAEAYQAARAAASATGLVLVTGSVFVVAEVV